MCFRVHNKLEVFSLFHTTYISQMSLSYVSYPETFYVQILQYAPIQYVFIDLNTISNYAQMDVKSDSVNLCFHFAEDRVLKSELCC